MSIALLATLTIAATSVCFGLVPLFGRTLLDAGLSPEAIAFYRFGLALPLALVFLPRRRAALRPGIALAGAGLAGGLGWTTFLGAIEEVPVASAGVVYMSYPLFVVALAWLLVGQRITTRAAIGAGLVLAGAFLVNAPGSLAAGDWRTLLSILPAPAGFALIIVMLATVGHGLTTMERWSVICVGQVAGLLPAALLADAGALLPGTAEGWAWIAGLAIVTATIPQLLFTLAARSVSASRTAAAGAAELPTMLAVGWIAFGEVVGLREATGALMVVASIMVTPAVAPERRRRAPLGALADAPEGRA